MNTNIKITRDALLLLTAGGAALLAGCGGGGGNGNTGTTGTTGTTNTGTTTNTGVTTGTNNLSQVAGKVTDVSGKGVPGVSISVDTGGQITSTSTTGDYRLTNLKGDTAHKISAFATVNGVQYSGSTYVYAALDPTTKQAGLTTNGNLILSPTNQQATVQGTVKDVSGNPVSGAGVYLAVPNVALGGSAGNYSSLAAFTDSRGVYVIANVPTALPAGSLVVTASTAGAANQSVTLPQNSVTPNNTVTQNFTLTALSTGAAADQPTLLGATSFTQSSTGLTGSALQARLASGSLASGTVYETLRRALSPTYAAYASRHHGLGKRLLAHATASNYAIEMDLAFNPPAATNTNLGYYNVYRTTGALPVGGVIESTANFHDTLFDPLANYYTEVTALSDASSIATPNFNPYVDGTAYNFAVSSVSTTKIESAISTPAVTITPLGPLTLNTPTASATVVSPVTLSWTPVAGATKYYVFIYTQYPSIGTLSINSAQAPLPAGTGSATLTLGGAGATYYAIVVATADETEIAGATTPVPNAAQSYSAITPFTVQ